MCLDYSAPVTPSHDFRRLNPYHGMATGVRAYARDVGVQVGICSGLFWIPRSEVRDDPAVSHAVFGGDQFV